MVTRGERARGADREADRDPEHAATVVPTQMVFAARIAVGDAALLRELRERHAPHRRSVDERRLARQAHEPRLGLLRDVADRERRARRSPVLRSGRRAASASDIFAASLEEPLLAERPDHVAERRRRSSKKHSHARLQKASSSGDELTRRCEEDLTTARSRARVSSRRNPRVIEARLRERGRRASSTPW